MAHDALETYLNDHLAGSTLGLEHARDLAKANDGTPLGETVSRLADEIEADRDELIRLMERAGASENPVKKATAWVAEKAGQVKFRGVSSGDRDLGNYLALETLSLGVAGKLSLWEGLAAVADQHPALAETDLAALTARAKDQRATLEAERLAAARVAFAA